MGGLNPTSACGSTFHPSFLAPMGVAVSPTYGIPAGATFHPSPHGMPSVPARILAEPPQLSSSTPAAAASCSTGCAEANGRVVPDATRVPGPDPKHSGEKKNAVGKSQPAKKKKQKECCKC